MRWKERKPNQAYNDWLSSEAARLKIQVNPVHEEAEGDADGDADGEWVTEVDRTGVKIEGTIPKSEGKR